MILLISARITRVSHWHLAQINSCSIYLLASVFTVVPTRVVLGFELRISALESRHATTLPFSCRSIQNGFKHLSLAHLVFTNGNCLNFLL
jgi:hypothetical protein